MTMLGRGTVIGEHGMGGRRDQCKATENQF